MSYPASYGETTVVFEHSDEIQQRFLNEINPETTSWAEMSAGRVLGEYLLESVYTGQKIVQLIFRATDYNLALGMLDRLESHADVESLPADLGSSCFWNKYHALEDPIFDIAPVHKETHSLEKQHSDVAVLVTSGLSEPAAISGNLRRVRERFGPAELLVATPTATYEEIMKLLNYLVRDRILDARLLLAASPQHSKQVRSLLHDRSSYDIPDDTHRYPEKLDHLREDYLAYRATHPDPRTKF
jgi:hypothetical protein